MKCVKRHRLFLSINYKIKYFVISWVQILKERGQRYMNEFQKEIFWKLFISTQRKTFTTCNNWIRCMHGLMLYQVRLLEFFLDSQSFCILVTWNISIITTHLCLQLRFFFIKKNSNGPEFWLVSFKIFLRFVELKFRTKIGTRNCQRLV